MAVDSGQPGGTSMDFTSHDGEKIWYKVWKADTPRAVIQIMTGLAETADYYEEMAKYLNQAGYSVALHEYRQHGRTRAGYGDGNLFRNYARDGAQLCSMLRASRPGLPVVLFAHSLGTTVSQIAIYEKMEKWDGVIYTGPSCKVMPPERKKRLLPLAENSISKYGEDGQNLMLYPEVFARLNAPFAAEKSPYSFITSDSSKWKWIARLPFKGPDYSNRFFRDFILLQADLATKETLENIVPPLADTPILLLTGSNDVTAANGTYGDTKAILLCKAGYKDVTSIVYPGLRHSVLQEKARLKVIEDITGWMNTRF